MSAKPHVIVAVLPGLFLAYLITSCDQPAVQPDGGESTAQKAQPSPKSSNQPPDVEHVSTADKSEKIADAMAPQPRTTLVVLASTEDTQYAEILYPELSGKVDLQERLDLDEIVREQRISFSGSPQLEGVDGAVIVERLETGSEAFVSARFVSTELGVVLGQWLMPEEGGDLESWSKQVAESVLALQGKLSIDPKNAVGLTLLNFTPELDLANLEAQYRSLTLRKVLASHLQRLPNLFVLERDYLGDLQFEKSLLDIEPTAFRAGAYVLDGQWEERDGTTAIELKLRAPSAEPEVFALSAPDSTYTSLAEAMAAALQERFPAKGALPVTNDSLWHPGKEAVLLYDEAIWLEKLGRNEAAVAACEAALALAEAGLPEDVPDGFSLDRLHFRRMTLEYSRFRKLSAAAAGQTPPISSEQLATMLNWFRLWLAMTRSLEAKDMLVYDPREKRTRPHPSRVLASNFEQTQQSVDWLLEWYRQNRTEAGPARSELFQQLQRGYAEMYAYFQTMTGTNPYSFEALEKLALVSEPSQLVDLALEIYTNSSREVEEASKEDMSIEANRERLAACLKGYSLLLSRSGTNIRHSRNNIPSILYNHAGQSIEFESWRRVIRNLQDAGGFPNQFASLYLNMWLQSVFGGPETVDRYDEILNLVFESRHELAERSLLDCMAGLLAGVGIGNGGGYGRDYLQRRYQASTWIPLYELVFEKQPVIGTSLGSKLVRTTANSYKENESVALSLVRPVNALQEENRWWMNKYYSKNSYVGRLYKELGIPPEVPLDGERDSSPLPPPTWDSLFVRSFAFKNVPGRPLALATKGSKVSFLINDARMAECDWKKRSVDNLPPLPSSLRSAILDSPKKDSVVFDLPSGNAADREIRRNRVDVPTGFNLASHASHIASLHYRGGELVLLTKGAMASFDASDRVWRVRDIPFLQEKAGMQFIGDSIVSYVGAMQATIQGQGIFRLNPTTLEGTILSSSLRRETKSFLDKSGRIIYGMAPGRHGRYLVYRGGIAMLPTGHIAELDPETGKADLLVDREPHTSWIAPQNIGWNNEWSWAITRQGKSSELRMTALAVHRESGKARLLLEARHWISERVVGLDRWETTPGGGPTFYALPNVPKERHRWEESPSAGMYYDGENFLVLGGEFINSRGAVLWWWNKEFGEHPIRIPLEARVYEPADIRHRFETVKGHNRSVALGFDRVRLDDEVLLLESSAFAGFSYLPRSEVDEYIREQMQKHGSNP